MLDKYKIDSRCNIREAIKQIDNNGEGFIFVVDKNGKVRTYDIFGVNPIRYGPTIRMGWEQIHISAFYSLSEAFEKNKGEKGKERN